MKKPAKRIAITGAAGQIAYSLLFRIANGELFGKEQPVILHLVETPQALEALRGVCMELEDGAYPLVEGLRSGSDASELFGDVELALLIGAKPRSPGMERGELLEVNGKLFIEQGKALDQSAHERVQVVVVGNPCNTNCLLALKQAKRLSAKQFSAMTRLDQNRATALLASKARRPVGSVRGVTIWGNHSATQVVDGYQAEIDGKKALEVIGEEAWLQGAFLETVQKRGASILAARGKSSAASAAQALIDHVRALYEPTAEGEWFSMAVYSEGNGYGIDQELVFSFPCRSTGEGSWVLEKISSLHPFIKEKMAISERELQQERQEASCCLS